nr:putative reverse transcriptase domain-containing protein [Tanacetum cinerariifolium]
MFRACVLDVRGSWDVHLSLVEFLYNNSYYSGGRCVSFEALYGKKCRSLIMWAEIGEGQMIGPKLMQETTEKISQIKDRLKVARDHQKSYVDKRKKPLEFSRAITELVYLGEAHHHLNPIFISKYDSRRRINDGKVMLVLKARDIPLRFGEVQLSLVALNPKLKVFYALSYNQLSGPLVDSRSYNLLVFCQELVAFFHLVLKMNHIRMKDLNDFKSRAFQVLRFKLSNTSSLAKPVYKCGYVIGVSDDRIDQAGSGVAGRSSSRGGGGGGGGTWDDPEAPGAPEAPDGPAGGEGGGGDPDGVLASGKSLKRFRSGACIAQSTASVTTSLTAILTCWGMCNCSSVYRRAPCLSNLSSMSLFTRIRLAMMCSSLSIRCIIMASALLYCGACGGGNVVVVVVVV